MPVNCHDILALVGLRVNALRGGSVAVPDATAAGIDATYNTRPLTLANWQSVRFPFTAALHAITDTEAEMAQAISSTDQHPFRKWLETDSNALASGAQLPTAISTAAVLGKRGEVRDATSNIHCTEQPFEVVGRKNDTAFFATARYYFTELNGRIFHTRTNVVVKLPVYDESARRTAAIANGAVLFPALAWLYASGALSKLFRDGFLSDQASLYAQHYLAGMQNLTAGDTAANPLPNAPVVSPES